MRIWAMAIAGLALCGCVSVGSEAVIITHDELVYQRYIDAARAGDPDAQFRVGNSLCCSPGESKGPYYNTVEAVRWLCASARQGDGRAMRLLGKIYSGDTIDGVRALRRIATGLERDRTNLVVAYVWSELAKQRGQEGAAKTAAEIWLDMSASERFVANRFMAEPQALPCLWRDVVGT